MVQGCGLLRTMLNFVRAGGGAVGWIHKRPYGMLNLFLLFESGQNLSGLCGQSEFGWTPQGSWRLEPALHRKASPCSLLCPAAQERTRGLRVCPQVSPCRAQD